MTSLLSTVRCHNGLRTVETTASQALVDGCYHQRHGIDRHPKYQIVSFLARAWPSCSLVIIRSLKRGFTCLRPRSWRGNDEDYHLDGTTRTSVGFPNYDS